MNDRHFDLCASALDFAAAIKCGSFDDAMADLARAALTFANASPPESDDQADDYSDCA